MTIESSDFGFYMSSNSQHDAKKPGAIFSKEGSSLKRKATYLVT